MEESFCSRLASGRRKQWNGLLAIHKIEGGELDARVHTRIELLMCIDYRLAWFRAAPKYSFTVLRNE